MKSRILATLGPRDLPEDAFVRVSGPCLIEPNGDTLFIKGTNLGNWLNPEGYMFGFQKTNSAGMIDQMFCEMVGPDFTAEFWRMFKDNYVTEKDIEFIASTGANTFRVPFHYKLFTDEDYMGLTTGQDGFNRLDDVIGWCRKNGLYVILDMHDAPQWNGNFEPFTDWTFDDKLMYSCHRYGGDASIAAIRA